MAKRHEFYFSDSGAGKTGLVPTGKWLHLDGGAAGAFPTIVELSAGSAPGWYYFEADIEQRIVVEVLSDLPLVGDDGVFVTTLEPEEHDTSYTTWYDIRASYRDDPGLLTTARPTALIRRLGDAMYWNDTTVAWQAGVPAVVDQLEMPEVISQPGVYSERLPFAAVSDTDGRFIGHDGYLWTITGEQGIRTHVIYPSDAGYEVWASIHRGANIPVVPMTGGGLRVIHQRVQWSDGDAGETITVVIRRISDGLLWDTGTSTFKAAPVAAISMVDVAGFAGLYEFTILETELDRALGREGYDVQTRDSGLEVKHTVRYMPVASHDDLIANHATKKGSVARAIRVDGAKLNTKMQNHVTKTVAGKVVLDTVDIVYFEDSTLTTPIATINLTATYDASGVFTGFSAPEA